MKILQLIHKPQNRGAETFACQLSYHLLLLGHDVKMVAIYNGEADLPFSPEIETLNGEEKKKVIDIPAWRKLSAIIKNFEPDVIQANSGDTLKYAVFSKLIFKWNIPIISRNASQVGRYLNNFFQIKLNKFLYKHIDGVVSVSNVSKEDIVNHFPFLSGMTEVIPVGLEKRSNIDLINFQPQGKKHILHIGGFSFEKNHSGLLNILEIVLKEDPNIHLHLIGDGPLKNSIEQEVQKRGLNGNVTFYGFISQPLTYIKSAEILVLPSIIEGLPGVLLEAMYCKTPVIAYNVGGISEIINSNTGTLVNAGDEKGFAKGVLRIIRSPDEFQVLNAYKNVESDFMNDKLALSFVNIYERCKRG